MANEKIDYLISFFSYKKPESYCRILELYDRIEFIHKAIPFVAKTITYKIDFRE